MTDSLSDKQRRAVAKRSRGRCEALVRVHASRRRDGYVTEEDVWTRCYDWATEIHHIIKRSRGGDLLDRVHETYHLAHLCSRCHRDTEGNNAYEEGSLIAGQVLWDDFRGVPYYIGPDEYLTMTYPDPRS
jgi:hypothetical protein